jgi:small-conductance mechanosensitive channel
VKVILYQNLLENFYIFFNENIVPIIIAIVVIVLSYLVFLLIKREINSLAQKKKIDNTTAKNMTNMIKIFLIAVDLTIISLQFIETLGIFMGVFTAAGGTIIGFAAINTLGNLIAGVIIMFGKPFKVGDRIKFKDRLADVVNIKLVYTILEDIDGVTISVPNQKMLKEEIENYGTDKVLRRQIFGTAGYDTEVELVEKAFLEGAAEVGNILQFPEPRVDVFEFLDFAIQYRLIVYINNSKIIPKFDFDLRRAVLKSCKKYGVDLSTPTIIQPLKSINSEGES